MEQFSLSVFTIHVQHNRLWMLSTWTLVKPSILSISYSIILEKLAAHGFNKCILRWVKNWLDGQENCGEQS